MSTIVATTEKRHFNRAVSYNIRYKAPLGQRTANGSSSTAFNFNPIDCGVDAISGGPQPIWQVSIQHSFETRRGAEGGAEPNEWFFGTYTNRDNGVTLDLTSYGVQCFFSTSWYGPYPGGTGFVSLSTGKTVTIHTNTGPIVNWPDTQKPLDFIPYT